MKKGKVSKYFIDIIVFIISFNITDFVTSSLGIKYEKFLSFEFALIILIGITILCIFEFIVNKIIGLLYKNKS